MSSRRIPVAALVCSVIFALLVPAGAGQAATATKTLISDTFDRADPLGWGSAATGGTWIQDTREGSSVSASHGVIAIPPGGERYAYLPAQLTGSYEASARFSVPQLPTGGVGVRAGLTLSRIGGTYYYASVRVTPDGYALLSLSAVSAPFLNSRLTFETLIGQVKSGSSFLVQALVPADSSGAIQAKAWVDGNPVPSEWQVAGSSSAVSAGGSLGVQFNAAEGDTGAIMFIEDISASQQVDTGNVAPTASFTATLDGSGVTVDASASSDPDGTIASYLWDFGDGSTSTGVKPPKHNYRDSGTYTITLTVTDSQGATATSTQDVTVSNYVMPSAETTGVPESKALKTLSTTSNRPYSGDTLTSTKFIINTPGAVYDGWRFDRLVEVKARGVKFTNCYFEGINGNPPNTALLQVYNLRESNQVPSAIVEDSTMIPKYPNNNIDGVRGSNFSLLRVEISKTVDGMQIYGSSTDYNDPFAGNVLVDRSWIHDLIWYDDDSHSNGTHNDGLQISGGRNVTVIGSRIDGTIFNAAIYAQLSRNVVSDLTVVGNILGGGSCSVNVYDAQAPAPIEGLVLALNGFVKGSTANPDCAMIVSSRAIPTAIVEQNVWTNGSLPGPTVKNGRLQDGWEFNQDFEVWQRVRPAPEGSTEANPADPQPSDGAADARESLNSPDDAASPEASTTPESSASPEPSVPSSEESTTPTPEPAAGDVSEAPTASAGGGMTLLAAKPV